MSELIVTLLEIIRNQIQMSACLCDYLTWVFPQGLLFQLCGCLLLLASDRFCSSNLMLIFNFSIVILIFLAKIIDQIPSKRGYPISLTDKHYNLQRILNIIKIFIQLRSLSD